MLLDDLPDDIIRQIVNRIGDIKYVVYLKNASVRFKRNKGLFNPRDFQHMDKLYTITYIPRLTYITKQLNKVLFGESADNDNQMEYSTAFVEFRAKPSIADRFENGWFDRFKAMTMQQCSCIYKLDLSQYYDRATVLVITPSENFSNIRALSLCGYRKIASLSTTFDNLPNLHELELSGCSSLTDISALAKLPSLQTLDLSSCSELTDISVLGKLHNLRNLDLFNCTKLSELGKLPTSLCNLNLAKCKKLVDIFSLGKNQAAFPNLQKLDLSHCSKLSNIEALGKGKFPILHTLNLHSCERISNISALADLSNLRELRLSRTGVSDILALSKERLPKLRMLHLTGCTNIPSSHLSKLSKEVNIIGYATLASSDVIIHYVDGEYS